MTKRKRMKPVRAWVVVVGDHATTDGSTCPQLWPSKWDAKYESEGYDSAVNPRIARVEIRECQEKRK